MLFRSGYDTRVPGPEREALGERAWGDVNGSKHARLKALATVTAGLIYVQILLGAVMRHTGAGLAIPDFPLMFVRVIPTDWDPKIAVHFSHRIGALVVLAGIVTTWRHVRRHYAGRREFDRPATFLVALVAVQITLGALTVLTARDVWINSLHVVCGALVLTTALVMALRSWRSRFPGEVRLKRDPTSLPSAADVRSVRLQPDSDSRPLSNPPLRAGRGAQA